MSARAFMAMSVSPSTSAARERRDQTLIGTGGAPGAIVSCRVTLLHGPAANAMRYVLSGADSAKPYVTPTFDESRRTVAPLASARHVGGVVSERVTRALRSG